MRKTIKHFKLPQMLFNFLQIWGDLPQGAGVNPTIWVKLAFEFFAKIIFSWKSSFSRNHHFTKIVILRFPQKNSKNADIPKIL
jgi:hypothetical protein